MIQMKNEIQNKVRVDIDEQQREYFLNQQLKQIQEELGGNSHHEEVEEMRRARDKKWSKDVAVQVEKDLKKLQRLNPQVPDYSIQRNYLETVLELPWDHYSKDKFDLKRAENVLDKDHYGLEKVKERHRAFGSIES